MFIRATKTHVAGGQPGYSYRLVRSVRQDGKVRQKTLLNLGTEFSLPRSLWPHVTSLTEDLLLNATLFRLEFFGLFRPQPDTRRPSGRRTGKLCCKKGQGGWAEGGMVVTAVHGR